MNDSESSLFEKSNSKDVSDYFKDESSRFCQKNKKLRLLFFVLLIFVVCLAIFLLSTLGYKYFVVSAKQVDHEAFFRYTEFDEKKNTKKIGHITKNGRLPEQGFISENDGTGNHILISNFGTDEYKCTGTCYCDTNERRSAIAIKKGLTYLVAAVTSLSALNFAKKHFDEECKGTFSEEECPKHAVRSDVKDCENIETSEKEDSTATTAKTEENLSKSFDCTGNCLEMLYYDGENVHVNNKYFDFPKLVEKRMDHHAILFQKHAKEFGCHEISLEKTVNLQFTPDMVTRFESHPVLSKHGYGFAAHSRFITHILTPHCENNSMKRLEDMDVEDVNQEVLLNMLLGDRSKGMPMCSGHVMGYKNPSVKCVQK